METNSETPNIDRFIKGDQQVLFEVRDPSPPKAQSTMRFHIILLIFILGMLAGNVDRYWVLVSEGELGFKQTATQASFTHPPECPALKEEIKKERDTLTATLMEQFAQEVASKEAQLRSEFGESSQTAVSEIARIQRAVEEKVGDVEESFLAIQNQIKEAEGFCRGSEGAGQECPELICEEVVCEPLLSCPTTVTTDSGDAESQLSLEKAYEELNAMKAAWGDRQCSQTTSTVDPSAADLSNLTVEACPPCESCLGCQQQLVQLQEALKDWEASQKLERSKELHNLVHEKVVSLRRDFEEALKEASLHTQQQQQQQQQHQRDHAGDISAIAPSLSDPVIGNNFAAASQQASITYYLSSSAYHTGVLSVLQRLAGWSSKSEQSIVLKDRDQLDVNKAFLMEGSSGNIAVELAKPVFVEKVALFHPYLPESSPLRSDVYTCAPSHITFYGHSSVEDKEGTFLGSGSFDPIDLQPSSLSSTSNIGSLVQTFSVLDNQQFTSFPIVRFHIVSNHGNNKFTCIYKVGVYGSVL